MYGISVRLPVVVTKGESPGVTKNIAENTKQNMKNLLLTSPGEKVMDVNFGVGLRQYLFENNTAVLRARLEGRIRDQVSTYMPFIRITQISVFGEDRTNKLEIYLRYDIKNVASDEILNLSLDPKLTS